ncbi:MAG: carbohydrate-binding domain-containing protein [Treponema sp.]|nr:carbohydrate-binding domain-containing protein [Treponema sp.]
MIKLRNLGFLIIIPVLVFTLLACDSAGSSGPTYEPLIIRGSAEDRAAELEISTTRTVERSTVTPVLSPATGDSYVLRYTDVTPPSVISRGSIEVNGIYITFIPTGGGERFTASSQGLLRNLLSIPLEGGTKLSFAPIGYTPISGSRPGGSSPSGPSNLTGEISISPNTSVTTGTVLTATYTGPENVSFQWKRGTTNTGTDSNTYSPAVEGSYTVTVSAAGFNSKTSEPVVVTGATLDELDGDITITTGSVTYIETGVTLTAAYDGSETITTYVWRRDGSVVSSATSSTLTTTQPGAYTVTVSAAGTNTKTSTAVTVYAPFVYVVTGTGNSASVTRAGVAVGVDTDLNAKLTHIRTNANGTNCTIQFGTGTALNLGQTGMAFQNDGSSTWGTVTITGGATSTNPTATIFSSYPAVQNISLIIQGTITNTSSGGSAILHASTGTVTVREGASVTAQSTGDNSGGAIEITGSGTLTITGGTVRNTYNTNNTVYAIKNTSTGTVNISGGLVEATQRITTSFGIAIFNGGDGKITVSGGTLISGSMDADRGTITLRGGADQLVMEGGTVTNTADHANARVIHHNAAGTVTINGGTVEAAAANRVAIFRADTSTGTVTVNTTNTTIVGTLEGTIIEES